MLLVRSQTSGLTTFAYADNRVDLNIISRDPLLRPTVARLQVFLFPLANIFVLNTMEACKVVKLRDCRQTSKQIYNGRYNIHYNIKCRDLRGFNNRPLTETK